jgi:hypothetical protein
VLRVYSSLHSLSLDGASAAVGDAVGSHDSNYICWNSAHCLYPWNTVPNKTVAFVPKRSRGRLLNAKLDAWCYTLNTIDENTVIRVTPMWSIYFECLESQSQSYHWEKEVSTIVVILDRYSTILMLCHNISYRCASVVRVGIHVRSRTY